MNSLLRSKRLGKDWSGPSSWEDGRGEGCSAVWWTLWVLSPDLRLGRPPAWVKVRAPWAKARRKVGSPCVQQTPACRGLSVQVLSFPERLFRQWWAGEKKRRGEGRNIKVETRSTLKCVHTHTHTHTHTHGRTDKLGRAPWTATSVLQFIWLEVVSLE